MTLRPAALIAAICIFLPLTAYAQRQPVFQDGIIPPNHLVKQGTDGLIKDVGEPAIGDAVGQGVSPFGVNDKLNPLGVVTYSADPTVDGSYIALGHNAAGVPTISVGAVGGASAPGCNFDINGTVTPCVSANIISVVSFGAVCDGATDDAAAFRALWSAGYVGLVPEGRICAIGSTITGTKSAIGLIAKAGATLKWIGACNTSGSRIASIVAPYGSTANKRLTGNVIEGIKFDGNAGCARDGLYLASLYRPVLASLSFIGGFNGGTAINYDVVPATNGSTFGEAPDLQSALTTNLYIDNRGYTSTGLRLGMYLPAAGAGGNASFNTFVNTDINGDSGATSILCWGCDNNSFLGFTRVFNAGTSVDLTIATNGARLFAANGNKFELIYYSGAFVARGTTSFPTCGAYTYPLPAVPCTFANSLTRDATNSTPDPTIEAGAQLQNADNLGDLSGRSLYGQVGVRPAFAASEAGSTILACAANGQLYGATATSYFCNTSGGAALFLDDLTGDRYAVRFGGSGGTSNLVFTRSAGTGLFEFGNAVMFDAAPVPASNYGVNLGVIGTANFNEVNARYHQNANSGHSWTFDTGMVAGSADANAVITHDANPVITFRAADNGVTITNALTVAGLPSSAGAGGLNVCVDTAGVFYKKASCP